jgi:hypothetical protein
MPCSVLLLMDACHSGAGARALLNKPGTDDLTRSLTDSEVLVTILSAAMSNELAGEGKEHGFFTQALLEGLALDAGVSFDPEERQLYVNDLYTHVLRRVRRLSERKQNPFIKIPEGVPPLAIREVPTP